MPPFAVATKTHAFAEYRPARPGWPRNVVPAELYATAFWSLRLGIDIERIKPGHPEQNGRRELMHLTLKKEATKPAAQNSCSRRQSSRTSSSATTTSTRHRF
jgi:hypothetical protein